MTNCSTWNARRNGGKVGTPRFARRAVLAALLTLYSLNKSSNVVPLAFGQDPPGSVDVEMLFDFDVPVGVIAGGVFEGLTTNTPAWFEMVENESSNYLSFAGGWYSNTVSNAYYSIGSSSGELFRADASAVDSTFGDDALGLSTDPEASESIVGSGSASGLVSDLNASGLAGVAGLVAADSAPALVALGVANPIAGATPSSGFWVTALDVNMIKAIDGGRMASMIDGIPDGHILQWLRDGFNPALSQWCQFVNQSWISLTVRSVAKVVAILLFWLLAYRFVLHKMVIIVDAALNTVRRAKVGG